jgi:hypothetical protein
VTQGGNPRVHERWARLRFSIVGHLLAAPPEKGGLRSALAAREWRHPTTGKPTRFGLSTIERWYYRTLRERQDPVGALRRKRRRDAGQQASMGAGVAPSVAGSVRRTQELERPTPLRQPGGAGRDPARDWASAILFDGPPLPSDPWPGPAPPADFAAHCRGPSPHELVPWGAGGRGTADRTRGTQLRSRVCRSPASLGFPSRLAQGADGAR